MMRRGKRADRRTEGEIWVDEVQAARAVGVDAQCLGATGRLTGVGVGCITGPQPASIIGAGQCCSGSGRERERASGRVGRQQSVSTYTH